MFKTLSTKTVYKNRWMEVFEDEIEFPNGKKGIYGYIKRSDGAGIAVVNENNEILLVKQYRYPIKKTQWGIPGGAIDGQGPVVAAIREVKEETGVEVETVEKLYEGYAFSSASSEKEYIYFTRVTNVIVTKHDVSDDNELVVEKKFIPISQALMMIDAGEISEPVTASVIHLVAKKLNIS